MAKILCAAFLMGLKSENDARVKAETIKTIGENLQGQVITFATRGQQFIQAQVIGTNGLNPKMSKFIEENLNDVLSTLRSEYFDETIKIEVRHLVKNQYARGSDPLWVDSDTLPSHIRMRKEDFIWDYIFEITW